MRLACSSVGRDARPFRLAPVVALLHLLTLVRRERTPEPSSSAARGGSPRRAQRAALDEHLLACSVHADAAAGGVSGDKQARAREGRRGLVVLTWRRLSNESLAGARALATSRRTSSPFAFVHLTQQLHARPLRCCRLCRFSAAHCVSRGASSSAMEEGVGLLPSPNWCGARLLRLLRLPRCADVGCARATGMAPSSRTGAPAATPRSSRTRRATACCCCGRSARPWPAR